MSIGSHSFSSFVFFFCLFLVSLQDTISIVSLCLLHISTWFAVLFGPSCANPNAVDVTSYGAVGDGVTDDSKAFRKGWEDLCGVVGGRKTLVVPEGKTFLLHPVTFAGPCSSRVIHIQVLGDIVAPNTRNWGACDLESWILIVNVSGVVVDGSGKINGRGSLWWRDPTTEPGSCPKPTALRFYNSSNIRLSGLTHIDSPKNHVSINICQNVIVSNLHVFAPGDSPNTDGIIISTSTAVRVDNCVIGTGDDCVTINNGTSNINVTRVTCGPGHGISIGSLGADGNYSTVEDVLVRNCSFIKTRNGVRIKTWPGGSGYARKIKFEQIKLLEAQNPIIIDQYYCDGGTNCRNETATYKESDVGVKDVTYSGFEGTSADVEAILLKCSSNLPCKNIVMDQIRITSVIPGKQVRAVCENAKGMFRSAMPEVHCLAYKNRRG